MRLLRRNGWFAAGGMKVMSLRRKFAVVFVAFALFIAFGGGWLAWTLTSTALEDELDEKLLWTAGAAAEVGLTAWADVILRFVPSDAARGEVPFSSLQARLISLRPYVDEAYIFGPDLQVRLSTEPLDELPLHTPLRWLDAYGPELDRTWTAGEAVTPAFVGDDGRLYKYAFHRLGDSEAVLALLVPTDFLEPLARLRTTLLVGALVSALLATVLAFLLAGNIVRPLERLARDAIRIQRGHWQTPVKVERGDELGRLSRAMERMRRGIIQRDEQLRLMLAQVAHEIRNPLGGLELFASAAMETDDRDERLRLLARVRHEVEGLNNIINEFLAFARPVHPEPRLHDLREPVREAIDILREVLGDDGVQVTVDLADEPLLVRADPDHVKRVVLNLVQNAAQAGSRVRVCAWWRNGEGIVSVQDNGPGVPDDMREQIFEPFVTDKEQGAGLGLAIVQRMMETNGGRVELMRQPPADGVPRQGALRGPGNEGSDGGGGGAGAEFRLYFTGSEDLPPEPDELDDD
jgi:signal transduction histidine kinase